MKKELYLIVSNFGSHMWFYSSGKHYNSEYTMEKAYSIYKSRGYSCYSLDINKLKKEANKTFEGLRLYDVSGAERLEDIIEIVNKYKLVEKLTK
jgi:hypothetical protein